MMETNEPMKIYLQEIEQIPFLTGEEEQNLCRKVAAGDESAKMQLEEGCLRLVVTIAREFTESSMHLMDMIQEGNIGLMSAVEAFDYGSGESFSSFAALRIKEAISQAVMEEGSDIKIPAQLAEAMQKVQQKEEELKKNLDREITSEEIARNLTGRSVDEVEKLRALIKDPAALEMLARAEENPLEADKEEPEKEMDEIEAAQEAVESLIRKEEVQELLAMLDPQQQQVLRLKFGIDADKPLSYEEIAEKMNITVEKAEKLEAEALQKLRNTAEK